ncbi:MAG: sensor histidine kinase, partial [Chloroflexi bacterium]|nr:sensor histidine kinase [Chloroflexota bacterium]
VRAMEEATRLKDDFLSAAAHDLKTPLTTMVAQAQLLAHRAKRNPAAPADLEGIERIIQQANRLKELVLELLDVSRVEYGKLVGRHETVDLVTLVGDACARHTTDFYRCMLIAPEQLVGTYDRLRLMQLLDNLLENAVKYSPEGGEVRVTLEREANNAHLTVTDQGIGIPATDLPHLFDRFYRGINVDDRQFAGLGLGLYICSGIVEQHGGRLWATSPGPGEGSAFHAVLPLPTESLETPVNISDDGVQLAAGALVQEE